MKCCDKYGAEKTRDRAEWNFRQSKHRYGFTFINIFVKEHFSYHKPMFYNCLLSEEFWTEIYILGSDTVPVGNLKDSCRIVYPNNIPEVK